MSIYRSTLLLLAMTSLAPPSAEAQELARTETVFVQLRDGRVVSGRVGEKTDDHELWLFAAEPSILIQNAIDWPDVISATIGDRSLTAAELRESAEQLKSALPVTLLRPPAGQNVRPLQVVGTEPRVQSLEMLVSLANWDADAETDGLEVRLQPLAGDGQLLPTEGMVSVRLYGRRLGTRQRLETQQRFGFWNDGSNPAEYHFGRGPARYVEIGHWSERIRVAQFTPSGCVVRLAFRRVHPERDLDLALDGLVNVDFSAQRRVVHASAPIELRAFNPYRDELQLNRQTRFLPGE